MIKRHVKTETVEVRTTVIDCVVCNCCGKEIANHWGGDYLHVSKTWGYFSNYDEEVHEFDICQECYENFIKTFKVRIAVES